MKKHILFLLMTTVGLVAFAMPAFAQGDTTASGLSKAFNPSIGANGLFIGSYTDRSKLNSDEFLTGLHIQEVEFSLMSVVDPYLRIQLTFSISGTGDFAIEEGYVQTTSLPRGLEVRIGKWHLPFGKQNRLHTHAFPFIDPPWINSMLLADDGLDEVSGQVSYIAPLPWFSEVAFVVFDPKGDAPLYQKNPNYMGFLGNWRNLWDLNSNTTFEIGVSGASAKTSWLQMMRLSLPPGLQDDVKNMPLRVGDLYLLGTDATVKHTSNHFHNWDVSVEYIQGFAKFDNSDQAQYGGVTGYGRFQVLRRWWVQGRGDLLGIPMKAPVAYVPGETLKKGDTPWRLTGGVAFVPSEFTVVRMQYDYSDRIIGKAENRVMLQLNITFGAHPAHSY